MVRQSSSGRSSRVVVDASSLDIAHHTRSHHKSNEPFVSLFSHNDHKASHKSHARHSHKSSAASSKNLLNVKQEQQRMSNSPASVNSQSLSVRSVSANSSSVKTPSSVHRATVRPVSYANRLAEGGLSAKASAAATKKNAVRTKKTGVATAAAKKAVNQKKKAAAPKKEKKLSVPIKTAATPSPVASPKIVVNTPPATKKVAAKTQKKTAKNKKVKPVGTLSARPKTRQNKVRAHGHLFDVGTVATKQPVPPTGARKREVICRKTDPQVSPSVQRIIRLTDRFLGNNDGENHDDDVYYIQEYVDQTSEGTSVGTSECSDYEGGTRANDLNIVGRVMDFLKL